MTDEVKKEVGGTEKKASKKDASISAKTLYENMTHHRLEILGHGVDARGTIAFSKEDLQDERLVSKIQRSLELGLLKKI